MPSGLRRTACQLLPLAGLLSLTLGCASTQHATGPGGAKKNVPVASKADQKPSPQLCVTIAQLQARKGDVRSAEASFRKALELDRKYMPAYAGLGRLYDSQREYLRAEQIYQAGLKLDPKCAMLWNDLGLCHAHVGRFDAAIKAAEKASNLAPDNDKYENNLATVLAMAGMPQEALVHFGHTVGAADAHYNVGYLLKQRGFHEQAVPYLRKTLKLNPQHTAAANLLVQLQAPDPQTATASAANDATPKTAPDSAAPEVRTASSKASTAKSKTAPAASSTPSEADEEPVVHAVAAFPLVPVGDDAPDSKPSAAAHDDRPADKTPSQGSAKSAGHDAEKSEPALVPLVEPSHAGPSLGQAQPPAEGAQSSTPKK